MVVKKLSTVIAISLLFSSVLFAETTIRITNGEWEPFMSQYSFHYGINSHIVSESFKLDGINVVWGFYPWKRAYELAKKGTWDASATWWPSDETRRSFLISDPVSNTSFVFFHLKSKKFDWHSFDDLKGLHIGGTIEYDYGKDFMAAKAAKKIYVGLVPKDEQNYKKLLAGRIDIFPNDPIVGYSQIRNSLPPEKADLITHHPKEFEKTTLHLIISKKCKNGQFFIDKFNSGFRKLKESGRFDQMQKDLDAGKYDKQKVKWKEQVVTMGVGELSPLISNKLKHFGVVSRIIEDSFALVDVKTKYMWAPWNRAYHNVTYKVWDLSPGWTKTPERQKEVNFSDPVFEKYHVFFHMKSFQFDWQSFDDLKNVRIGASLGYFYGEAFKKAEKEGLISVQYVPKDVQCLKKMLAGRIHVFPLNILTGYSLIQEVLTEEEANQFTHHPKKLAKPTNSYVVFAKNPKNERMMRLFNEGLKKLKESGKYKLYFEESNRGDYKKE